jgi:tRNA nucleotidyltransferase (CCA-adding enzyme)
VDDPTQPELLDRLRARRWAEPLLRALEGDPPVHLVGGAVRDLLLGRDIVDLDVVVEGDALPVARAAAERLGGKVREHDRFGTATVSAPELVFDVVTARRERYTQPGALPEVEAATLTEDLARRDFTVNALALRLTGADRGELAQAPGGLEDLRAGQVRVRIRPASATTPRACCGLPATPRGSASRSSPGRKRWRATRLRPGRSTRSAGRGCATS